jgi:RND family efflux transporter MFP subunit
MTPDDKNTMIVEKANEASTPNGEGSPRETQPKNRKARLLLVIIVAAVVALGVVLSLGIRSRVAAENRLAVTAKAEAIATVSVVHPKEGAPAEEIILPGTTEAFTYAPIYARTNGYLQHWYFDIGARVKQGQLLAVIDTPEIDQQLQQARADLETAQANLQLAKTTSDRWQFLVKSGSVSKQETDQAVDNLAAMKATVDSSAANVRRLEQLQSFEKIYAPFDGVITARNTDVGDLIDAGASTQPKQLFNMAAIRTLRVYVPVPEVDAPAARPGASAVLTLDEYPGETFQGKLVRTSNSIDTTSRTLLVEVDVDNPADKLLPGAYVFVHLKLPMEVRSVTIPANTVLFRREGLQVGVVRNGRAELVPIKIGRDYGNAVEVVSGLTPSDAVILDPADSLLSGTPIHVNNPVSGEAGQ